MRALRDGVLVPLGLTAALALAACGQGQTFPDDLTLPLRGWEHATAEDAGLDPDALEELARAAEEAGSACLVVTRDGYLVDERYWSSGPDTRRNSYSVTKSITATLVGIARDRGLVDLDDSVADHVPEWSGTPSEDVLVGDLLAQISGRAADPEATGAGDGSFRPDETAAARSLDQEETPGERWMYNNAAVQVLDAVLSSATGMPTGRFAEEALFAPTGMGAALATDPAGNTLTYTGAEASCRDLARLGLLHLGGGRWGDQEVVSPDWVREATSPASDQNAAYGLLWWLNRDGDIVDLVLGPREGPLIPEVSEDMYAAIGRGGQAVVVFPEHRVVASTMSDGDGEDDGLSVADLAPAVEAAVTGG